MRQSLGELGSALSTLFGFLASLHFAIIIMSDLTTRGLIVWPFAIGLALVLKAFDTRAA